MPQEKEHRLIFNRIRRGVMLAIAVNLLSGVPILAEGYSGAYLAARSAMADSDFTTAARYFTRALVRDPSNAGLMQSAIVAQIGQGDIAKATAIARRLQGMGQMDQVANILLLSDAVQGGRLDLAMEQLNASEMIGPLVDGLVMAWIQVGQGEMATALATFDEVSAQPGLQAFGLYHKALALALVGDLEGADAILSGANRATIPDTRRGVLAHAEILSQLERNQDALARIDAVFGTGADPSLLDIRTRLAAGETLPLTAIASPRDGVAEVFFSVAGALSAEVDARADNGLRRMVLIYARMAEFLRPDHVDATLLSADILEGLGQYELATVAYDRIARDDPAYHTAELARAKALGRSGRPDAEIEVLEQLAESYPDLAEVHVTLGDVYRRQSEFEKAAASYDRAIALYGSDDAGQWVTYYTRGITFERLDRWDQAEADFRKALELNPGQPNVLNYLGYSLVEMQTNLDEALGMIEQAVRARPNDGYITDSLGWVLYRLGRYSEAVEQMELAAALKPADPIVNDHLGDVYWAVGRHREAEFQWRRAMSFEPEKEDEKRIRRKLEVGLDAVLKEEGADPISFANDG